MFVQVTAINPTAALMNQIRQLCLRGYVTLQEVMDIEQGILLEGYAQFVCKVGISIQT